MKLFSAVAIGIILIPSILSAQSVRNKPSSLGCHAKWRSDMQVGNGWSVAERSDDGSGFRWTTSKDASLKVSPCVGQVKIELIVAAPLSVANLEGLKLRINSAIIPMKLQSRTASTIKFVGAAVLKGTSSNSHDVVISVPGLDELPNSDRRFGVPVRELSISN